MPTITYDKKDLLQSIGKQLSDKQLEETISLIKPSVEGITKDEITVELTPDRPDLFGIEGLARAIRAYLGINAGLAKYALADAKLTVKADSVPVRPFIACAVVKKVRLTDELIKSLMNIQEVLHETIGRKRKKVAIGIHDLRAIKPPIAYRAARPSERFVPLGESKEMTLEEVLIKTEKGADYGHIVSSGKLWPVYADGKGIFSFPPILNSNRTKVTEGTKSLFVELTGTDKQAVLQTLNIIVTNLAERGCKIEAIKVKYKKAKKSELTPMLDEEVIEIDESFANKWIGLQLSGKEMIELLQRMGFDAMETKKKKLEVLIPAYRADILHPVDVVEDIAIAYGYNNLSPELPNVATTGQALGLEKLCSKIRQLMIGFGFQEVLCPTLSNLNDQFDKMNLERKELMEIANPVSEEYTVLRVWLLPSLMKVLAANKHVEYPQNIFEIGDAVLPDAKEETMSKTVRKVAATLCHSKASFSEIKSIAESLLRNLDVKYSLEESASRCFITGRAAEIIVNGMRVGRFGELHPSVLSNWQLEMPVASFEIDVEKL